ncbi:hypothetical protein [Streptomyces sp. NPDC057686]|uniref:Mu transposase domain-containing protein n=1 Tax=Streptomyces sp. NPDC057686 TaxID=3346212 RepID=UPI0036C085C1
MPYIRDSFWSGRPFTSLDHMQAEALTWARETAGRRQCRPLQGAAPLAVFKAAEAEALLSLPETPFVLAKWSTATVGPDIHIKVGRTRYSVPWKLIGRRVDVRSTATMVQVLHDGALVKTHAALEQGKRTDASDYPPEKIAFQMRTPMWCRSQASEVGDACREVIDQLLEVNALYRLRAAQGVLGLRKKYGDLLLEAACAKAILVGDPSYYTIKGILVAGTETTPNPTPGTPERRPSEGLFGASIPTQIPVERNDAGMLETLDARLAQAPGGELGHLDFLQVLCQDEITRLETVAFERRLRTRRSSSSKSLWRASTSTRPRSCPPPRSASWRPCAGSTPASP